MHQGFTPALLLVAHVYSRNSSTTVRNLPRSDNWVVSPCRMASILWTAQASHAFWQAGEWQTELSLSLSGCQSYSSTGPRQLKAGAGIFGGTVDVHKVCCCRCSGRF